MLDKLDKIQEYIYINKKVEIKTIKKLFNLSDSTLRRYLNKLESQKIIIKQYGYVLTNSNDNLINIKARIDFLQEVKTKLAFKAAGLVKENHVIFVDSGSSHMDLAKQLSSFKNLTIVTNNLLFAIKGVDQNIQSKIIVISGIVNPKTISVSGELSISALDDYFFDISFITASGLSDLNGCSNRTLPESELKRKIMSRSKLKVLVVDDSKFEQSFPFSFAKLNDFDYLVTNKPLPKKYLKSINSNPKIIID
jgi:DeoR family transcriptional regulator, myo-inositol catabolism operon repressor